MPDVNWKDRNASEQFISDALWWLETFDLDGARVDAVKHVEDLATRNLVAQINQRFETVGTDYYLKGETAMGWSGHSLEVNQEQYGAINSYMGAEGLDGSDRAAGGLARGRRQRGCVGEAARGVRLKVEAG